MWWIIFYVIVALVTSMAVVRPMVRMGIRQHEKTFRVIQYDMSDLGVDFVKSVAIGCFWPVAIPFSIVYFLAAREVETYKTPKQLQDEINRLERELGIGDGRTRRN